jgi:uncharacterized metal-binding protein YceD (DUF177 family)
MNELHRPIAADRIGPRGLDVTVEADAAECAALAKRMGIPDVLALTCMFCVTRERSDRFAATGHLCARVVQTCVVSLEDFEVELEEDFQIRFVPVGEEADEVDPEDPVDEVGYTGGMLDLGETAAEQLGLALDPYPRRPGATLPEQATEHAPHPFDVLRRH